MADGMPEGNGNPDGNPDRDDAGAQAQRRAADRLLLRVARHTRWWIAVLAVTAVAGAVAETLLPATIGRTVDAMIRAAAGGHPGSSSRAAAWFAGSAVLIFTVAGTRAACQLATGISSASSSAWLRHQLARHVLGSGPRLLGRFQTGDTVGRLVGGAAESGAAPASSVMAVAALVVPAGSVLALGLIDPWLALAFCACLPVLALMLRAFVRDTSDVVLRYQQAQGAVATRLVDALAGMRTIAAAGTRDREVARVLGPLALVRRWGEATWRLQGRVVAQASLMVPLLQVVVLAVAGFELARHRITPGDLLAAGQYAVLGAGIGGTIGQLNRLARARAGGRRIAEVLSLPLPGHGTAALPGGPGRLEFRRVTVRLGGDAVLRSLDLTVPGGCAVAVVGRSGAGKSVLAELAGRLADPDEGEVRLDEVPLGDLAPADLRRAVVYAFERPALFGRTPDEAIRFGAWRPDDAEVLSAAGAACAGDFIRRLPAGWDTALEDAPMSGGEVQRLGLARAFAHAGQARLLVLDDATSSLDTVTEMQVSRALTGELQGRTALIVAHRASTAARAHLVAWLDDGQLRALRPHQELWSDPRYRAVFGDDPGSVR